MKDDFPVSDLLYAPHLLDSIDDTTYNHNFINCSEEKFEYGHKFTFTYTKDSVNYKKVKIIYFYSIQSLRRSTENEILHISVKRWKNASI